MSAPRAFLAQYDALDRTLVKAGFPATSPWWRSELERLFGEETAPSRRRWIIRAGRRAGKSTTLARLAVAWALFGAHAVPLGDIGVVSFVSLSKDEASSRLRTIAAILKALGIKHDPRGDEIEISITRPVLFKVFACNTGAVVGFTSIAVFCDEVARWESRDSAANPAKEIIGSLAPTMATVPAAFMVLSSSPWGVDDEHALAFERGETAAQMISFAESWIANPTITEAQTHELEPDDRTWQREYAAIPGAMLSAAFDPDDVAASFAPRSITGRRTGGFLAIDASSLKPGGDGFAWAAGYTTSTGEIVIDEIDEWDATKLKSVDRKQIVKHLAARARHYGARRVFGDQCEQSGLVSDFKDAGLALLIYPWSSPSKDAAFQWLRRTMRDRRLHLPNSVPLRKEMSAVKERLTPSGLTQYTTNGLDRLSTLISLGHAACAGDWLPGDNGLAVWTKAINSWGSGLDVAVFGLDADFGT